MEGIMLSIKYGIMVAAEIFVFVALGISFILGIYEVVRDKVEQARRVDEIATEILPDASKAY